MCKLPCVLQARQQYSEDESKTKILHSAYFYLFFSSFIDYEPPAKEWWSTFF